MVDLATCAEMLQDQSHRLALLEAWLGWRGDDLIPTNDAVIAEDLGTAIGYISVLEMPPPDRAIFRLVGEWYERVADWNLLGGNFIDMVAEEHRSTRSERCWNMATIPCGMLASADGDRPSGRKVEMRALWLPVSPTSPQEPMRLYFAEDVDLETSMVGYDSINVFPAAWEIDYVGIGYGVPV